MRHYFEHTDDMLVTLTLAGDQMAYEELVIRHQKKVLAAAYAVTRNNYMAEDAAQDAFVTGWMKLDLLNDPEKFCPWVCRIARNLAKNMLIRFRDFIPMDNLTDDLVRHTDPELEAFEENEVLKNSVERLPEKVQRIIYLHYFEGLSVAEIAAQMMIPVGTVKWQLHDGRQKLRKELCAMNEKDTDTLVEKVMKKVEELKLWQITNDKTGFAKVYGDVLTEVENLPESADKAHALADVLIRGWWWIPGEKNDALFARIKEAAIAGHNDEVMASIVRTEDEKLHGEERITFVKDTQIPFLEKNGFKTSLGCEWFWLGYEYFRKGDTDAGFAAYDKVLETLEPRDMYYANALSAIEIERLELGEFAEKSASTYNNTCTSEHIRIIDGEPRYWSEPGYHRGHSEIDISAYYPINNSAKCDGRYFVKNAKVGDIYTGSGGATLKYAANGVTVETPCGTFENCQLWETHTNGISHTTASFYTYRTYYKDGVGIVRFEVDRGTAVSAVHLTAYNIVGGTGLLPFHEGNTWEYKDVKHGEFIQGHVRLRTVHADSESVNISAYFTAERLGYDDNDWNDMVEQMHSEYLEEDDNDYHLNDVSHAMERAKALADTPYRIAYTDAACEVMKRIFDTDGKWNPGRTHSGHWNFFDINHVYNTDGRVVYKNIGVMNHFELKITPWLWQNGGWPIMFNMIHQMLNDSTDCLWNDEWLEVREYHLERNYFDTPYTVDMRVTEGECVTTAAGEFKDCVKVALDIKGLEKTGICHFGGLKDYYFAPGVGIVRVDNHYYLDDMTLTTARYDLTSYEGTGEGYMPLISGMRRHYDALDLKHGYIAYSEYTCETAPGGMLVMIENLCGIREIPKE